MTRFSFFFFFFQIKANNVFPFLKKKNHVCCNIFIFLIYVMLYKRFKPKFLLVDCHIRVINYTILYLCLQYNNPHIIYLLYTYVVREITSMKLSNLYNPSSSHRIFVQLMLQLWSINMELNIIIWNTYILLIVLFPLQHKRYNLSVTMSWDCFKISRLVMLLEKSNISF